MTAKFLFVLITFFAAIINIPGMIMGFWWSWVSFGFCLACVFCGIYLWIAN